MGSMRKDERLPMIEKGVRYGLAFSGGCDSSYLLASMLASGADVKAYMVKTQFQADFEVEDALRVIREVGAEFELIEADVLSREEICANPWDRCYFCKHFIFGTILEHMAADSRTVLVDGTNASDDPARRPGFRA
ncbi:MAG: TIGR00268 family protein, partial [Actinobacteria bacterium]|nr:TIGR00268 family protein [Actinomycetota bacterium]